MGSRRWLRRLRTSKQDPFTGHLFVFRGRRGDLIKIIWWDGQEPARRKRLEKGRFVWPSAKEGDIRLTAAQLAMLLEGIQSKMYWSKRQKLDAV